MTEKKKKKCKHKPDYVTVQLGAYTNDDKPIFDVNCKNCGMSGSFILFDEYILWD